jgi:hypothetical protein
MKPIEPTYALHYTPDGGAIGITRDLSLPRATEMFENALKPQPVATGAHGGTYLQPREACRVEILDDHGTVIKSATAPRSSARAA